MNSLISKGIEFIYSDYFKTQNILMPGSIEFKDANKDLNIKILIKKLETPWNGNIEFFPGNRYEKIELL
jgi:hypothetical protein